MNTPVPAPDAPDLSALVDRFGPKPVEVSPEVARAVLWFFGDSLLGRGPGGFTTLLIRAISVADVPNRARLGEVFPEHVAAVAAIKGESGGLERMQAIVRDAEVSA